MHIWKSYVKRKIEEWAVRKWVEEGKGQSSLRYFVQSEEDFGNCSTMDSSWNFKCLTRIQIGDMYRMCVGGNSWIGVEDDGCWLCGQGFGRNQSSCVGLRGYGCGKGRN